MKCIPVSAFNPESNVVVRITKINTNILIISRNKHYKNKKFFYHNQVKLFLCRKIPFKKKKQNKKKTRIYMYSFF